MTIRIGNAPCSWGVEFPNDLRNPPWRQVLKECAQAGYRGIELGPVGYMPEDPAILGEALAEHELELIGGVLFVFVLQGVLGGWAPRQLILHAGVALLTVGGMWSMFTYGLGVMLPAGMIFDPFR